jgi:FMN phosphatase YigB (HAD superfamily)
LNRGLAAVNATLFLPSSQEKHMTLTLLLDLDDTCLGNSMDTFIPAYLQALGDHLDALIPQDKLIPTLLASIQLMLENNRPDRSLKQVFDEAFFPPLGIDPGDFQDQADSFYANKFPKLKSLTQFRPEAVTLVEQAFKRGYTIAIATNPLFPRTAILQRLEWAGLSPEEFTFSLIPAYETFHFAKPNESFFAEFLSRMGSQDGPVVMVGDSQHSDIEPACRMGLATYWITPENRPSDFCQDSPHGFGSLTDLIPWLDSIPDEDLIPNYSHPEGRLAILRATPAVMAAFAGDLDAPSWTHHPQPGEWSFTEIMCHLRDVEVEVNFPRIIKVIQESNPFLPGIDTDKWAEERLYYRQNGQEAQKKFTGARIQLLDALSKLSPEDWMRPARHAIFGPTNIKELVRIIVDHDRLHTRQAYTILGEISQQAVRN